MHVEIINGYPFIELFEPMLMDLITEKSEVIKSEMSLNCSTLFAHETKLEICKIVVPRIYKRFFAYRLCSPLLNNDGMYSSFISSFKNEFSNEFERSGLLDLAIKKIEYLFSEYISIAEGIEKDKALLLSQFGFGSFDEIKVDNISLPLSEPHISGCVRVVTFVNNKEIIFKPRCSFSELHWHNIVKFLKNNGRSRLKSAYCLCTNGDSGWMEYIINNPLEKESGCSEFYQNMGELLFWLWLIGARDVVRSNVIACGSFPILVDCETIFYPKLTDIPYTLGSTGALPEPQIMLGGGFCNTSAICLSGQNKTTILQCDFNDPDEFVIEYKECNPKFSANIPILSGNGVYADDFLEDIKLGFVSAAEFALSNKDFIYDSEIFSKINLKTRIAFRPTIVYGDAILSAIEDSSQVTLESLRRRLDNIPINYCRSELKKKVILDFELDLLSKLIVPAFYLDEDGQGSQHIGENYFDMFISGKRLASRRLNDLNRDMVRDMAGEIAASFVQG